jgi:uncharacterized RDD family membrane protein YckC
VTELPAYPESAAEREAAQGPPEPAGGYASWGRRAAAFLVDTLLTWVVIVAAFGLAFAVMAVNEDLGASLFIPAVLLAIVGPFVYYTWLTGKTGQTIGKRALGIRVRHQTEDRNISYGAAFGRYAITIPFGFFWIPLLIDYLFPLWDKQNQTLHDKVASSIVVRAQARTTRLTGDRMVPKGSDRPRAYPRRSGR